MLLLLLLAVLTLGIFAKAPESMMPPAWKLDSDPIENQDCAEASDRTEAPERMDPADLVERFDP